MGWKMGLKWDWVIGPPCYTCSMAKLAKLNLLLNLLNETSPRLLTSQSEDCRHYAFQFSKYYITIISLYALPIITLFHQRAVYERNV